MDEPDAKNIPFDSPIGPPPAVDTVSEKLHDVEIPGYLAEFDPEEADVAGAFFEDALSEADALASVHDVPPHSPPP
jgi:hypothetical protein